MKPEELDQLADAVAKRINKAGSVVRGKRKQQDIPEYLNEEEISRLLGVITNVRDKAIFTLVYYRGLRASEIALMDVRDYLPATGRLTFRRLKGSRGGEYHLTEEERAAMKTWLRKRGPAPGALFPSRNHQGISRKMLHVLMRRYCALANIPIQKAHMHALKHSCGTHLSSMHADVAAIQDHMGHVSIVNTMKYVQISSRRRLDFAAELDRGGWGSKGGKKPK